MKSHEERLGGLEKLVKTNKKEKEPSLVQCCIFCNGQYEEGSDVFGQVIAADLIADEITRQVYQIEQGKEFPRVDDPSECKLHDDSWLIEHSSRASGFICAALSETDVVDIDPFNPKDLILLLTDFDTMDFVFHRRRHKRILQVEIDERNSWPYDYLDTVDYYYEWARKSLRTVGKKWIASLDPEVYGPRHLRFIEEYGPNFARGGVIYPKEIRERKKKEFESWLDKAEKELGKGLVQNYKFQHT